MPFVAHSAECAVIKPALLGLSNDRLTYVAEYAILISCAICKVGWLLETGTDPRRLSRRLVRFITMVLRKKDKNPIPIYMYITTVLNFFPKRISNINGSLDFKKTETHSSLLIQITAQHWLVKRILLKDMAIEAAIFGKKNPRLRSYMFR
jgi:hypothetical protein